MKHRISAPSILFLAIALLAACGSVPPEVAEAQRLFDERAYDRAQTAAEQALAQHPRDRTAWRIKVQSAFNQGHAGAALDGYKTWYELSGGHDRGLLERLSLTILWQGLRVPSRAVRTLAIQTVERLEVEKLAKDVDARMTDDDDVVAAAAAVALLRSRPGAPRIASQLLSSDEPQARTIAVEGIARKIGASARADLIFALRDPDGRVRRAGIVAIAAMNDAADTAALIDLGTRDPDPMARAAALGALASRVAKADATAIRAAQAAVGDADPRVQIAGLELLEAVGDRPALQRIARDQTVPWLAWQAHVVLANGDDALLAAAVAHPSFAESAARRVALAERLARPGAAGLRAAAIADSLAGDPDSLVRVAAAAALYDLGDERGARRLADLCTDPDAAAAAVRAHASRRLVTMGLVAALLGESALTRIAAAEAVLVEKR